MNTFDAWYLPGISSSSFDIREHQFGELDARVPQLTPPQLQHVLTEIRTARQNTLIHSSHESIAQAIAAAAARIASPRAPEGSAARALLPRATGYSRETIEDLLQHMTADWGIASLHELLRRELGEETSISRAPALAAHVFSGNVPGVAVTAMIRALLVKAATFGKTASGEPVLPVLFAQALGAVAPELAGCLAITYWPGGNEALEQVMLEQADVLVIYGGADTVRSLRQRAPATTRVVEHGPRLSFGVVGRAADVSVAGAIALATATYDQQGCVSPHAVFVERGGLVQPAELAAAIAAELAGLATELPRRRLSHAEALAIRDLRARTEFRGIGGSAAQLFGPDDLSFTVLFDDVLELPVSCLNRTLYVIPIDSFEQLAAVLAPHHAILQSVALAGFEGDRPTRIEQLLTQAGVSRITSFERLPWPPMWWHHDGRPPLGELLS